MEPCRILLGRIELGPIELGVVTFLTDYGIDATTLARAVEEHGFDGLFLTEHTHIPTSRESPWPGGSELPRRYAHTFDRSWRWPRWPRSPSGSRWALRSP